MDDFKKEQKERNRIAGGKFRGVNKCNTDLVFVLWHSAGFPTLPRKNRPNPKNYDGDWTSYENDCEEYIKWVHDEVNRFFRKCFEWGDNGCPPNPSLRPKKTMLPQNRRNSNGPRSNGPRSNGPRSNVQTLCQSNSDPVVSQQRMHQYPQSTDFNQLSQIPGLSTQSGHSYTPSTQSGYSYTPSTQSGYSYTPNTVLSVESLDFLPQCDRVECMFCKPEKSTQQRDWLPNYAFNFNNSFFDQSSSSESINNIQSQRFVDVQQRPIPQFQSSQQQPSFQQASPVFNGTYGSTLSLDQENFGGNALTNKQNSYYCEVQQSQQLPPYAAEILSPIDLNTPIVSPSNFVEPNVDKDLRETLRRENEIAGESAINVQRQPKRVPEGGITDDIQGQHKRLQEEGLVNEIQRQHERLPEERIANEIAENLNMINMDVREYVTIEQIRRVLELPEEMNTQKNGYKNKNTKKACSKKF